MDGGEEDVQLPEGLRRRKVTETEPKIENEFSKDASIQKDKKSEMTHPEKLENGSYWLTRILILRYLGFIYCKHLAFLFCS